MEIDDEGLDSTDRKLLAAIIQKFAVGAGRRRGAGRRAVRGDRDDRGRLRAVPAAARLPRPHAAGPHRDGARRARTSRRSATRSRRRAGGPSRTCRALWDRPGRGRRSGRRDRPSSSRSSARFEVLVASRRADGSTRARLGRLTLAARRRRDAAVHAGRHERHGQGARPGRPRDGRRHDHPREHLPPVPAARATSASRGSAACTGSWPGTGRSSPTRAASRSSRSATCASIDDDGVTFRSPPRRVDPPVHAGARDRGPGGARRRTSRSRSTSRSSRRSPRAVVADATARTHRWAERSLAAHTRDRTRRCSAIDPGRPRPGAARARRRGSSRRCRSTASASAGWPATRRRRSATPRSTSSSPLLADDPRPRYLMGLGSPRGPARGGPRGRRPVRLACCRRGSPGTGSCGCPGGRLNLRNARSWTTRRRSRRAVRASLCRAVLAGLPGPSVPGQGAARVPPRDLSQPDLHPRLHGQDPGRDPGRDLPRRSCPDCARARAG